MIEPKLRKNLNIIVFGDIILDEYIKSKLKGHSSEANVPLFQTRQISYSPGGAANVASNIHSLHGKPYLLGTVGSDHNGHKLLNEIEKSGIDTQYICNDHSRPTCTKSRIYLEDQQRFRLDYELCHDVSAKLESDLIQNFCLIIKSEQIDAIILQDYNKGVLTASSIKKIIQIATKNNIKIFVDPKINNFWAYLNVFLFKPNLREVHLALKNKFAITNQQLEPEIEYIHKKIACKNLIITRGDQGMVYKNSNIFGSSPGQSVLNPDACGAGDTVISILCVALISGLGLVESCRLANIGAAQTCSKLGVTPVQLNSEYWSSN